MTPHVPEHLRQLALNRNPFPPTPDAAGYFRTGALQRDIAETLHCLLSRKGLVVLTGEVGTGKSTFIRYLLNSLAPANASVALVFNTFLQGAELLNAILDDFGLPPAQGSAASLARLNTFLLACRERDSVAVLVIDDAQNLSMESLELIRLLSSLETGQEKLLQIVIAGQPELADTLAQHSLRQLESRITKRVQLLPLSRAQTGDYVAFRLAQAGAAQRIRLGAGALVCLHRLSGGNPRRIHLLMDRCLYGVLGDQRGIVHGGLMLRAARDVARPAHRHRRRAAWVAMLGLGLAGSLYAATQWPAPVQGEPIARWHACVESLPGHAAERVEVPAPVAVLMLQAPGYCVGVHDAVPVLAWPASHDWPALAHGDSGEAVQALQRALQRTHALHDVADGLFGERTRNAVALFQARYQLPETGRADPLTQRLLAHVAGDVTEQATPGNTEPVTGDRHDSQR